MSEELTIKIFKQFDFEIEMCKKCPRKKEKERTCIGCLESMKENLLNYIEQLQQENEELKDTILTYQLHTEIAPNSHESINGNELICNLFTENKNLKNILTEFEKWLEEEMKRKNSRWEQFHNQINTQELVLERLNAQIIFIDCCLNKLQELKKVINNE